MPISQMELRKILEESFPEAIIEITDLVGDEDHYSLQIISRDFQGKSLVEQHRLVNRSLEGRLGTELHALSIKTSAP